ncbi:MAG TPA: trigger factor, partial [Bauldia sp.]|nr:trigger factor [Bauldia sp.]
MQVTETNVDGLKREFSVVIPAGELGTRLNERLTSLKDEVRIKGFRPGKVPLNYLKRLYGRSAMAEIVQSMLSEVARDTLAQRNEKAVSQPSYKLPEDEQESLKVLEGSADLSYTMSYEVMPEVSLANFGEIAVERPVYQASDEDIDVQLKQLAESTRAFATKNAAAANGDRVTISYVGKVNGETFPGGTDDNAVLTIGDGRFIPGFEEQLVGLSTGDEKTINVTFPADYAAKDLAGKDATFDIAVKAVASADPAVVDDQLAERLGLANLAALRDTVRQQLEQQYKIASDQKVKRQLLDELDKRHDFPLPPALVEQEFDSIWRQINDQLQREGRTYADEGTTEEAARADYRKIAERRVRLGLIMSEVGERNKIEVTDEETQRALRAQMRNFPGQEQAIANYYRQSPEAMA